MLAGSNNVESMAADKKKVDIIESSGSVEEFKQEQLPPPLMRLEAPKYLIGGLKRYVVPSGSKLTSIISADILGNNSSETTASWQLGTASYSAVPSENQLYQNSFAGVGHLWSSSGKGTSLLSLSGSFWNHLQHSVLLLEQKLQEGLMEGLVVGNVDKSARQVLKKHLI